MAKNTKIYLQQHADTLDSQKLIAGAEDVDLMILGAIFLAADAEGQTESAEIEKLGRFDAADIAASVKYWKGAGVLAGNRKSVARPIGEQTESALGETAHKGGVITHTGVEKYSNDELAKVLESRVSTAFVDEAQKAMGKMFNNGEIAKLVGIVDQLGFEEEAVLAILSYCVKLGKKSVSYAEKIAVSFHDEDIFTAQDVHAQIDYLERRNSAVEKVRALFGFGGRALSATEKKLFETWTQTYGFTMDVIELAYDITVDAIQTPAPKYTDKILKKWHENGLKSIAEIESFTKAEREGIAARSGAASAQGKTGGLDSGELDDWFEKVLQKSLGD